MAGPLSGIGAQTQSLVAAQAQQQSQQNNQGVRQQDERREARANEVLAQNAEVNVLQEDTNITQERQRQEEFFAANAENLENLDRNTPRGSLVNIAV